jgi:hypothetical protein
MLPKSQQIHPQNQSYVAQTAVSQCFSGVKFNLLDVARHELLRLPIPFFRGMLAFSLASWFQLISCQEIFIEMPNCPWSELRRMAFSM